MIAARELYARVTAPVTLIYGEHDWSRPPEREANLAVLRGARSITLPDTGHFAALEQPARVAEILLADPGPLLRHGLKASARNSVWHEGIGGWSSAPRSLHRPVSSRQDNRSDRSSSGCSLCLMQMSNHAPLPGPGGIGQPGRVEPNGIEEVAVSLTTSWPGRDRGVIGEG
jgi:hypothetical protein